MYHAWRLTDLSRDQIITQVQIAVARDDDERRLTLLAALFADVTHRRPSLNEGATGVLNDVRQRRAAGLNRWRLIERQTL